MFFEEGSALSACVGPQGYELGHICLAVSFNIKT